jgi:hypothetical protein
MPDRLFEHTNALRSYLAMQIFSTDQMFLWSVQPGIRKEMLEAISKVGPHCRAVRALGSAVLPDLLGSSFMADKVVDC